MQYWHIWEFGVFIWIWNTYIIFRCQLFLCTVERAFDLLCWSSFKKLVLLSISHSMNTRKANTSVKPINFLLVTWSKGSNLITQSWIASLSSVHISDWQNCDSSLFFSTMSHWCQHNFHLIIISNFLQLWIIHKQKISLFCTWI